MVDVDYKKALRAAYYRHSAFGLEMQFRMNLRTEVQYTAFYQKRVIMWLTV